MKHIQEKSLKGFLNFNNIMTGLFLVSVITVLTGCKGDEGDPVDYGPEVSTNQINDELNKPIVTMDPLNIKKGEFMDKVQSQTVAGQAYTMTGEVGRTVVDRIETDTEVTFKIIETEVDYSNSQTVSRELIRIASKPTSSSSSNSNSGSSNSSTATNSALATSNSLMDIVNPFQAMENMGLLVTRNPFANQFLSYVRSALSLSANSSSSATARRSFHNLKKSSAIQAPPDSVQKQVNCGGVKDCKLHVYKVAFDMLVWTDPSNPDKVHREFSLSPDVPFLSSLVSQCDTLLVPLEKGKTIVTLCEDVVNFKYSN